MTLRRICTIDGEAYTLTDNCPACGNSMWTSIDPPIRHAGCTPTQCIQGVPTPDPAPTPAINRDHSLDEGEDTETQPE